MDISFYEVILPKLRKLASEISEPAYKRYEEIVSKLWRTITIDEKYPKLVYGIDGGSRVVEFKGFVFSLVTAIAVGYVYEDSVYRLKESLRTAYVGKIVPLSNIGERIKLYREIVEGKVACHACKDGAMILMDGSIASIIVRPRPEPRFTQRYFLIEDVVGYINSKDKAYFKKLKECIDSTLVDKNKLVETPICSADLKPHGIESEELDIVAVIVEYIEKLYTYGKLIEQAIRGSCQLVFIAKTSHSRDLVNSPLYPDIILFEKLTNGKGISSSIFKQLIEYKNLPRPDLPEEYLNVFEYYSLAGLLYSYMRLEDRGPMLKVEVIGDYSNLHDSRDKTLLEVYRSLQAISNNGYPHPLRIAHRDTHITYNDMKKLLHLLGLDIESTGREVLE